ncbi:MAG: hypothetical protein K0U84_13455 [Actinomycetia bacterium]|nr:hypothetical protein [Actinomycetes bacterium]
MGAAWADTHMVGNGFPDAVLAIGPRNYLVEIKDGSKKPSARALTTCEQGFHDTWPGEIVVIETEEQLVDFINRKRGGDD